MQHGVVVGAGGDEMKVEAGVVVGSDMERVIFGLCISSSVVT